MHATISNKHTLWVSKLKLLCYQDFLTATEESWSNRGAESATYLCKPVWVISSQDKYIHWFPMDECFDKRRGLSVFMLSEIWHRRIHPTYMHMLSENLRAVCLLFYFGTRLYKKHCRTSGKMCLVRWEWCWVKICIRRNVVYNIDISMESAQVQGALYFTSHYSRHR